MDERRNKMLQGGSIREVFSSPDEVGSFIRTLIEELEIEKNATRVKEQIAGRRLDDLRNELHNHLCVAQKRLNFTLSDM